MDSNPSRADVEARLRETADAMADRFDSLQEEVSSTGSSLRDWVVQNPLKSVGGMLAAGVAVGALVGGGRSRRPRHAALLDQYVDALRTEVEEAMETGDTPGEAVEKALRGRAPLVVYRENGAGESQAHRSGGGVLGDSLGFVVRLVAREVIRDQILSWLGDTDVAGLEEELSE
ncbi:hypothetical protein [Salinibacter altiplanensis]|uniref:hypothetical protein n=1 Tax=Salinibacter altiplanensis TaxID=1803181 RepID=UPI000C9FEEBC|nr:hypothetical protein [Salinibacter altiplanensis]